MVDVDLGGLLRGSSIGVYCWGYLLPGKVGVGLSILKVIRLRLVEREWLSRVISVDNDAVIITVHHDRRNCAMV
jgi:hypothetical protein